MGLVLPTMVGGGFTRKMSKKRETFGSIFKTLAMNMSK